MAAPAATARPAIRRTATGTTRRRTPPRPPSSTRRRCSRARSTAPSSGTSRACSATPSGADRLYDVAGATIELPTSSPRRADRRPRPPHPHEPRRPGLGARLRTALASECSPLPPPTTVPLDVDIEEEFLPSLDLATGKPVATDDEPDVRAPDRPPRARPRDLGREAISLAEPIAPLRPGLPGPLLVCGERLDEGSTTTPTTTSTRGSRRSVASSRTRLGLTGGDPFAVDSAVGAAPGALPPGDR